MNIPKRRTARSLPVVSVLSTRMERYQHQLSARWQTLSSRDQMALGILMVFLLLFIGGYGGYSVHQAAKISKENYQEQVADYFWLRAQAGNVDTNILNNANDSDARAMPPASRVNATLNTSGIEHPQVIAAGDSVQLSFNHGSQVVVSAALVKLEQQGWQFTQLSIQQDVVTKQIQVQATLMAS